MSCFETCDEHPHSHSARPLIALAVDNEEMRATYAYALLCSGCEVAVSRTGAAWLASMADDRPVAVVADVSQDDGRGWALVQTLTHDPRTRTIPVVAMVTETDAETLERARREGCAAVCVSACDADVLTAGVRTVLARAGRPRP